MLLFWFQVHRICHGGNVTAVGTRGGHTVVSTVKKRRTMIIGAHRSLFDAVLMFSYRVMGLPFQQTHLQNLSLICAEACLLSQ